MSKTSTMTATITTGNAFTVGKLAAKQPANAAIVKQGKKESK